jgi:hypothetical protein
MSGASVGAVRDDNGDIGILECFSRKDLLNRAISNRGAIQLALKNHFPARLLGDEIHALVSTPSGSRNFPADALESGRTSCLKIGRRER